MHRQLTVSVPVPRRLLWYMRTRYDEATVADILRIQHYNASRLALAGLIRPVVLSVLACVGMAWLMPGGIISVLPGLALVVLLASGAVIRLAGRMREFRQAIVHIRDADPAKWRRIIEELLPIERECGDGAYESVTVTVRL